MVCGDLTAKILRNMPDYSSCYVYGKIYFIFIIILKKKYFRKKK